MTYAELKSNIASYLNRSDLTDVIDTFIDSTEAEFNRRLRVKGMIKRATATLTTQYLAVPTDWVEAINLQIDGDNFSPLFQQSIESMDCLLYTTDAADDLLCVTLRGCRVLITKHVFM